MPFPRSHRGAFSLPSEALATRFLSLLAFKLRRRSASDIEHVGSRVEFQVEYQHRNQAGPLFLVDGGRIEVSLTDHVPIVTYDVSTQDSALSAAALCFGLGIMAHYVLGAPMAFAAITAAIFWLVLFGTVYAASRAAWHHFFTATIHEVTARPHN